MGRIIYASKFSRIIKRFNISLVDYISYYLEDDHVYLSLSRLLGDRYLKDDIFYYTAISKTSMSLATRVNVGLCWTKKFSKLVDYDDGNCYGEDAAILKDCFSELMF